MATLVSEPMLQLRGQAEITQFCSAARQKFDDFLGGRFSIAITAEGKRRVVKDFPGFPDDYVMKTVNTVLDRLGSKNTLTLADIAAAIDNQFKHHGSPGVYPVPTFKGIFEAAFTDAFVSERAVAV